MHPSSSRFHTRIKIAIGLVCCAILLAAGAVLVGRPNAPTTPPSAATAAPTAVSVTRTAPAPAGVDTLTTLINNRVPAGDRRDQALRLKDIAAIPEVVNTIPADHQRGDRVDFFVNNLDTRQSRKLSAQLVYATQNVYFFVEEGIAVDEGVVRSLIDEFQNTIYPNNRAFFGSEWIPGVDGDPRLYMLYANGLGKYTGAYFDSVSEYSRLAHPYSNEKELIALNAEAGPLSDAYWPPTLAHEFQHMIHWRQNRNAETWLNEGASMLAQSLNGYAAGSKMGFLIRPDLQLNAWADLSSSMEEAGGHYAAAYLFMQYFFDRFGGEATQALVTNQSVGMTAVDSTLAALGQTDPATGQTLTAADVFADWAAANLLNNRGIDQGQYGYIAFPEKIPGPTDTIASCPTGTISAEVHQFGTRFIEIACQGDLTIRFSGAQQVPLVPTQPHGGRYAVWSSRADESDTTLTRAFDLTRMEKATLSYWAWWKIETDYDYAYLEVSTDGGETWHILRTPSGTGANPAGSNQGWGYTGCSGGGETGAGCTPRWVHEQVDLSPYAGQPILVRFEYITDAALSYDSLMLDDIAVPELNDACDFETDTCGWDSRGFAQVDNVLPQSFMVQLVRQSGGQTTVQRLALDAKQQGSLSVHVQKGDTAILLVSGTTPFTTQPAHFELEIR